MENEVVGARVAPDLTSQTSRLPRLSRAYAEIVRWSILVLFALMPLFFLPFTVDTLEVNKQTLLVIVTFVAALAWLGHMVANRELTLRRGWLNAFPAFLWLVVLIGSALSKAPFTSWIGGDGQEYMSFLTTTAFLILFYLLVNTASDSKTQRRLFNTLIISSAILAIFLVLQALGLRPLGFVGITSLIFNPVGGSVAAAVYLTAITLLASGLWLIGKRGDSESLNSKRAAMTLKVTTIVLSLFSLVYLIAQDYWVLWVLMLVGIVALFTFSTLRAAEFGETGKFILPMGLLVISLLLLFLKSPLRLNIAPEVTPGTSASWSVATQSLGGSAALFGTGPGTYAFNYSKYHGTALNDSSFWATRFDRGSSHLLTVLPSLGIVGLVALLLLIVALATRVLNRLIVEQNHDEWKMTFVLFAPWLVTVVAMAFYTSNMTLSFLFWALTGLIASQVMRQKKSLAFTKSPRIGLTFSFLFVLVAVGIVTGLFITGQRYAAEIAFAKAVSLDRAGGSLDEIIAKVSQATNYNRLSDTYERALAKALLVKVKTELSPAGTEIPPEKAQQIQQLIVASMTAAKAATTISPGNVANWEMLGAVYREMSPVVEGADVLSIEATQKAIELEPASPAHFNELAQAYLVFAENARARTTDKDKTVADAATKAVADYLLKAEEALVAAIALKTDYAPAHYYLAVIYERQGRLADAVVKMETVKKYNPLDVGVAFQLGLLYLRQGNYGLAQPELERAVQLTPSYSNARWFLAAIYEQKGEMAKAVEQVQKVLELNPENELVKAKLDRLKAGVKSSGLPEPIEVDDGTVLSDN